MLSEKSQQNSLKKPQDDSRVFKRQQFKGIRALACETDQPAEEDVMGDQVRGSEAGSDGQPETVKSLGIED